MKFLAHCIDMRSVGRHVTVNTSFQASGECVAHAIQTVTVLGSRAKVLCIDGIGEFRLPMAR